MKYLLIIILSIFLQSCASTKTVPTIQDAKPVQIDSVILQQCPKLSEDVKVSTFEDILTVYGDLATKYGLCANKQADSVKLLKQFGGIKDGTD